MTEAIELSDARQKQPAPTFLYILRHVVGVCILLLVQHPRFHQGAAFFLGVWVGAAAIALAGASAIAGLAFLYFTNGFGRNWRLTFAVAAWSIAAMQLLGQWLLPQLVARHSAVEIGALERSNPQSPRTPANEESIGEPPVVAIGAETMPGTVVENAELERVKLDVLGPWTCREGEIVTYNDDGTFETEHFYMDEASKKVILGNYLRSWHLESGLPHAKMVYTSDEYPPYKSNIREISERTMVLVAPTGTLIKCNRLKGRTRTN